MIACISSISFLPALMVFVGTTARSAAPPAFLSTRLQWRTTEIRSGHFKDKVTLPVAQEVLGIIPEAIGSPCWKVSSGLVGSSLAGCLIERPLPNTGVFTTMGLAALLSNLGLVPTNHPLYDLCWTTFLPASLALLLLSSRDASRDETDPKLYKDAIQTVSIPFLWASLGSIAGCVLSFLVCRRFPDFLLPPAQAAMAASCLCASFIGGTVNFFATANALGGGKLSTLMTSMASSDTFVMAIYFGAMALGSKSRFLSDFFQDTVSKEKSIEKSSRAGNHQGEPAPAHAYSRPMKKEGFSILLSGLLISTLAFLIVKVSVKFEKLMAPILPGTACAAIAVISPAVQRAISSQSDKKVVREMQATARYLSEFCLQLLFASIGSSAKLDEALLHGPACLCFSVLALSAHILIVFLGSLLSKRLFRLRLKLEDVLIASNAAVGGPATAAAFAGRLNSSRQRGLTIAGTFWGVVGYAVGTTIGVWLYRIFNI